MRASSSSGRWSSSANVTSPSLARTNRRSPRRAGEGNPPALPAGCRLQAAAHLLRVSSRRPVQSSSLLATSTRTHALGIATALPVFWSSHKSTNANPSPSPSTTLLHLANRPAAASTTRNRRPGRRRSRAVTKHSTARRLAHVVEHSLPPDEEEAVPAGRSGNVFQLPKSPSNIDVVQSWHGCPRDSSSRRSSSFSRGQAIRPRTPPTRSRRPLWAWGQLRAGWAVELEQRGRYGRE